jgi:hypothetical protein
MPYLDNVNTLTYSTTKVESEALRKGNWYIGTNDVGKGPTSGTSSNNNFWNCFDQSGETKYVTYEYKATQGASIRFPGNPTNLILYTNQTKITGTTFTTAEECFDWYSQQDNQLLLNGDIPAVITNGVSLYLEPFNVVCNPRNDRWWDLAQKLRFDAVSNQLPVVSLGGYSGFEFDGSGYWTYSTDPSLVDMGGPCTLVMWLYNTDNPRNNGPSTIFEKEGTLYQASQQEIEVVWETDTSITWYSRLTPGTDVGQIPSWISYSYGWAMIAIKMSTGKTSSARTGFYSVNGSTWQSSYTSNSNVAVEPAGAVNIAGGSSGIPDQGGVGMVMCYDRMLSDTEINDVWQASKALYGF